MKAKRTREEVYRKYQGRCAYCGKPIKYKDMQVDHLIPARRGNDDNQLSQRGIARGTDDFGNLMPSCRACNFEKGQMSIEKFRSEIMRRHLNMVEKDFRVKRSLAYGLLQTNVKEIVFYFEREVAE